QLPEMKLDDAWREKDMVEIVIQAPGKATQVFGITKNSPPLPLAIAMTAAGTMSGRITDEGGRPVAGATVTGSESLPQPLPAVMCSITDADGRYELADLMVPPVIWPQDPFGPVVMMTDPCLVACVRHPGFAPAVIQYSKLPATADAVLKRPAR